MKEKRRMISEAAKELGLETYTLRAWEEELKLNIPRNDKGYRYYGEKELHTFMKIRDMRDEGMSMDEIKEALPKNVIPFPAGGSSVGPQDKMEQFQNVMVKIMGRALNEQKNQLSREIGDQVTRQVAKEMDYQFRQKEESEEKRFQKLDELIRLQQQSREEIAATKERGFFFHNKKSKNRIIRINTGILSNMKQKIKEFYH